MKLKVNNGEKPLWSQLYDILEERILNGFYSVGSNLPTEMNLMDEFGVSRITVRQAMDKLIAAGLIARKRGKGTVVLEKKDKVETSFISSFNGIHEKHNDTDRRILFLGYTLPPIEVAYYFDISQNRKLLKLKRGIYVDDQLVSIQETYLNPEMPLTDKMNFSGSLYQLLESHGYKITRVKENITAAMITAQEKKEFDITKNEVVMTRIRRGFSGNFSAEFTYSRYLAKGYELIIELN
jgi:DNA-binding GntR family transcriptional regulator